MVTAYLHGFVLAIGLILPLGMQNIFIFMQGATQPSLLRVAPVVAVAGLCDTTLILLAVFGVSVAVLTIQWLKAVLIVCGVLFLLYFGWITWKSTPAASTDSRNMTGWTLKRQVFFTLSVSLFNPHAILDTVGVLGASSLSYTGSDKFAYTAACISVSWLWFCFLAVAGHSIGNLDQSGKLLLVLNRVSAIVMWGCAVYLSLLLR